MSLEQIVVARAVPEGAQLNRAFSVYHFAGYGAAALGSVMVGSPEALGQWMGRSLPYTSVFWLLLACALAQLVLYARLSEIDDAAPPRPASAPRPSGALIRRLAALFALDAFAGGFAMQSLISYWFYVRFGVDLVSLGFIFLGTQLLSAVSLLVAANVANRIGLINTMVFSHLISNGLLIAMAFAPSVTIAVGLLLARHLLSQMDVPTRQAYLMSVVEDHEREAAASVTNTTRTIAQAVSPAMTGYVMQAVSVSAPFVLSGVLKSIYDLLIYFMFRNIKPRGERSA
jgi:predicted MFS family arabinose efflux permease